MNIIPYIILFRDKFIMTNKILKLFVKTSNISHGIKNIYIHPTPSQETVSSTTQSANTYKAR